MKQTDYCPRAAALDTLLTGEDLIGIEIGVDVGAHAEALLKYCHIKKLFLIDLWDREYCKGFCEGRLTAYRNKISLIQMTSLIAAPLFKADSVDFIYMDQEHDYETVYSDLVIWWDVLKKEGKIGVRNYGGSNKDLMQAVETFVSEKNIKTVIDKYHNEIILYK